MENITSILKANKELQSKPLPKGVVIGLGKLSIDAENAKIAHELIKRSHEMGFNLGETKYTICRRWTALSIDDAKEVRAFINANMNEDGTFVSVTEAKKRIQEAAEKEEDKIKETPLVTIRQETKDGNPYKFILYIRPDQKGSEIMDSFFNAGLRCGFFYFKPGFRAFVEVFDTPQTRDYLNKNFKKEYLECMGEKVQGEPQTTVVLSNQNKPIAKQKVNVPVSKVELLRQ